MHNLSNTIPQCSVLCMALWKGAGKRVEAPGLSGEKNYVILPLGSRGGLREICLLILKGGGIQYSSDGNWIVPDTTCLSLSLSFSLSLSLFLCLSPLLSRSIYSLSFSSYICHKWFLLTGVLLDTALCTWHKLTVWISLYVQALQKRSVCRNLDK